MKYDLLNQKIVDNKPYNIYSVGTAPKNITVAVPANSKLKPEQYFKLLFQGVM